MLDELKRAAEAYDGARDALNAAAMAAFPVGSNVTFRYQRMGRWYEIEATVSAAGSSSFGHYHAGYIVITNNLTGASRSIHAAFHAGRGELARAGDAAADHPCPHGVTDDDGNLLLGQRSDGSPIWNDPEDPLPLHRVAHFTEDEARRKAWELAGAGYGPTGISELHHA